MKKTSYLLTALSITALLSASATVFAKPNAVCTGDELYGKYTQEETAPLSANVTLSGECGQNLSWSLDDEGTLTISGTGEMTDYSDSSASPWYNSRSSVKRVAVNDGVTSIGNYAFRSCTSIESITLPKSLKKIGRYSFFECISLDDITIPEDVTSIGYAAFNYCYGFTNITIPNSVTFIDEQAFSTCTGLKSVKLSNALTSIAYCAFQNCSSLTSITIPESVVSIDHYAFSNCTSLTSVIVPTSVTSIMRTSFNNSKNVKIYACALSYAQTYASTYNIPFEANAIKLDIGKKTNSENVRYVTQNGIAVKLDEKDGNEQYIYALSDGKGYDIVEIAEKTSDNSPTVIKSQYFYIDVANLAVTKLDLDTYTQIYDETTVRVGTPTGLRFKASISSAAKEKDEDFEIVEYGFIIATKEKADEEDLNFLTTRYVSAPAYVKSDGTDIIFDSSNDEYDVFTGVLYNIPEKQYKTELACRTYTKIKLGENTFTLYGEIMYGSLYNTAQSSLAVAADSETRKALADIIAISDKTPMIDMGDMYN